MIFDPEESKSNVIRLYKRLKSQLKQNEYVIVLPVDVLMFIVELYLSAILHGELNLCEEQFYPVLRNLFDGDFLLETYRDKYSNAIIDGKLFMLNLSIVRDRFQSLLNKLSMHVIHLEKYFKGD